MKTKPFFKSIAIILLFFLINNPAVAAGCSAVFPSPLQNSGSTGEINFGNDGQVFADTDNILETMTLTDKGAASAATCSTAFCIASGTLSKSILLPVFKTTTNPTTINTGANGSHVLGASTSDYKEIKTGGNSSITDEGAYTRYIIKKLELSSNDILTLRGGTEYWVDDFKFKKDSIAHQIIVNGSGTARLYVKKDLKFKDSALINISGSADNLLILAYKKLELADNTLNAKFIAYTEGDVKLKSGSQITGAIASTKKINLQDSNVQVTYDSAAVANVEHNGLCDATAAVMSGCDGGIFAAGNLILKEDITFNSVTLAAGDYNPGGAIDNDSSTIINNVSGLEDLGLTSFPGNSSGTNPPDNPGTVSAGSYNEIKTTNSEPLIFSGGTYHINTLNLDKEISVTFAPGSYYINNFDIEKATSLIVFPSGSVKIYIGNHIEFKQAAIINSGGDAANFSLYSYEGAEIEFKKTADITGTLYAQDTELDFHFHGETTIKGGVFSQGEIKFHKSVAITYEPSELDATEGVLGCTATSAVDHYAVSYLSNPGITCEANTIIISAHNASHDLVVPASGTAIVLSTTPAADAWSKKSGDGTFTAPDSYTFDGIESSVQLWLSQSTPTSSPHIDIDVSDGAAADIDGDAGEDENAQFSDSAFRFFDTSTGLPVAINNQIAGKPSSTAPGNQTLELRAVKTNTSTSACEAALEGSTAVEFAYECNDPLNCSAGNLLALSGAETKNIAGNNNGSVTSYTSVNMTFDSNGIAPFSFSYRDAGQIRLYSRKTLTSPAATLSGSSNAFVVRPFGFYMSGLTTAANASAANVFARAGDNFTTTVTAKIWGSGQDADSNGIVDSHDDLSSNAATPGFGNESSAQNMIISHTLRHPVSGSSGSLTGDTSLAAGGGSSDYSSGVTGNVSLSWSEVGIIDLYATLNNYLGSGENISSRKNNVGRFSAHHFAVSSNMPDFADSCNPFTYLDQTFYYNTAPVLTVTAKNAAGSTCDNYGGGSSGADGFWKLSSSLNRSFTDGHSTAPSASLSVITAGSVTLSDETDYDGEGVFSQTAGNSGDEFSYNKNAVEVPFNADIDISYTAASFIDDDGICYDPDDNGICDGYSLTISEDTTAAATELRYGRMVLFDVYGTELNSLNMPISLEYWDNIGANITYFINSDDSCTVLATSDILFSNHNGNLSVGEVSALSVSLSNGQGSVSLSAPGDGNDGKVCVSYDVNGSGSGTIQSWLEDNWSCAASSSSSPMGQVIFGIHPGNNRQIYMREQY